MSPYVQIHSCSKQNYLSWSRFLSFNISWSCHQEFFFSFSLLRNIIGNGACQISPIEQITKRSVFTIKQVFLLYLYLIYFIMDIMERWFCYIAFYLLHIFPLFKSFTNVNNLLKVQESRRICRLFKISERNSKNRNLQKLQHIDTISRMNILQVEWNITCRWE